MAKILILLDSYCYPAKDGVSIAIGSVVSLLENHKVSIYIYPTSQFYEDTESAAVKLDIENLPAYDIILTSPIKTTLFFIKNSKKFKYKESIALLSDCYTYALYKQIYLSFKFRFWGIKYLSSVCMRMTFSYFMEKRIAKYIDLILVQTPKDKQLFTRLFSSSQVINIPNIPHVQHNVEIDKNRDLNSVAFVASFVGSYLKISIWFFKNVWTEVANKKPNAKIHILGKGANEFYLHIVNQYPHLKKSIVLENYHNDISVFFRKMHISVAPIFKGYGLINKTVESMVNGCITIGDDAAFNGLEESISGTHCLIAKDADEFINAITSSIGTENTAIRINAINSIKKTFNKGSYIDKIDHSINNLLVS